MKNKLMEEMWESRDIEHIDKMLSILPGYKRNVMTARYIDKLKWEAVEMIYPYTRDGLMYINRTAVKTIEKFNRKV